MGQYLNRLVLFTDRWSYFDAWDIDIDYRSKPSRLLVPERVEAFRDGPRAVRRATYRHRDTVIVQDAVLVPGQPYVSFETRVDWHERWRMLRAEFAPSAWADEVACEIQFGHWYRSTRNETPQEKAQFEICAHRWIDLSTGDGGGAHGFSLLNRTKFGHRVKDGVVSLALLRAPVYPDPEADRGPQQFSYAVYPHRGGLLAGDTMALAADYNAPLVIVDGRGPGRAATLDRPLFTVERVAGEGSVVLETVTRAGDGEGVVVRLYEQSGRSVTVRLSSALGVIGARETDLLERLVVDGEADLDAVSFQPFELKTLRLDVQ